MLDKLKNFLFSEAEKKVKNSYQELDKIYQNSFLWAFFVSWLVWNWKFLYVLLFLNEDYISVIPKDSSFEFYHTKLWYIINNSDIIFPNFILFWFQIDTIIIMPLISSFVFLWFIEPLSLYLNNKLKDLRMRVESKKPVSEEEKKELNDKISNLITEKKSLIIEKNKTISNLETENEVLLKNIDEKANEKAEKRVIQYEKINKNLEKDIENLISSEQKTSEENEMLSSSLESLNMDFEKLKKDNSIINLPKDEKAEYLDFKTTKVFDIFWWLLKNIEEWNSKEAIDNSVDINLLKYLQIKKIIEVVDSSSDINSVYLEYGFTKKWNKFVEFYLDEKFKK